MELYTVPEVARLLKISRGKAYDMAKRGQLPAVRIGGNIRVRQDQLETWLNSLPPANGWSEGGVEANQ